MLARLREKRKKAAPNNQSAKLNRTDSVRRYSPMNSSVFCFEAGSLPEIYDRFVEDPERARVRYKNEQQYIEHELDTWEP